jgi:6-phospho-beta-glucosidase
VRVVVLGGSGASTPELFDALDAWPGGAQRRPPMEIVLVGRSARKLELVAEASRRRAPSGGAPVRVKTAMNLDALDGADVVLNQVRIGGLDAREFDETFARRHGLPGEETMGPGGFANALRTVPALRVTWKEVARRVPGALVINLTNPAGIVVQAARREFGLAAIEVCDSPITLCAAVASRRGTSPAEERRRYLGMNHVGWWVPPDAAALSAMADLAVGLDAAEVAAQGALPAAYVRYYLAPGRMLQEQLGALPRATTLRHLEAEMLTAYDSGDAIDAPRRGARWYGDAILPVIDAWIHGSVEPSILGLPLGEAAPNGVPSDAVIEVACDVPIGQPPRALDPPALPQLPAALLGQHAAYERLLVDALLCGARRDALVAAMAANPIVQNEDLAGRLVEDVLANSPG